MNNIVNKLKKQFNNSSDFIIKEIKDITIIFLESANSSDKVNDYLLKILALKNSKDLNYIITGPNTKKIKNTKECEFYLVNGFTLIIRNKEIYATETRASLYRSISTPQTQQSIMGPKDAFSESIQLNMGLIKKRIKTSNLVNEDLFIGRKTKTKVSILYLNDIAEQETVNKVLEKLNNIDIDGILDTGNIIQFLTIENKTPFPTVSEVERPDKVANDLLNGKIAILTDNSPFVITLPTFFLDFINPNVDDYNKNININFIKLIRYLCLFITILAPAIYIGLINYNQETIPLSLLINFSNQRSGVPFPAVIECFIMLILSEILRESDIRFPSTYGSSVSILGALILGNASVVAGIVSPIMIIVVAVTFVASLVFTDMEMINSLRIFRFILLFAAALGGIFLCIMVGMFCLLHICTIESFGKPYTYPLAPFDKNYFRQIMFRKPKSKDKTRSKLLTKNTTKLGDTYEKNTTTN